MLTSRRESPTVIDPGRLMDQIAAFILAGGASSRMGTDKAQLLINNEPIIQRIATRLRGVADSVAIVGRSYGDPDVEVVDDIYPQWGALGGIHAALNACKQEWAIIVACDLPFITVELIERLSSYRNAFQAVVPIQQDSRPQPLCALYRVASTLPVATELIKRGKRRPLELIELLNTRWVSFSELEDLSHSENFFLNMNTREDYYEATRRAAN